MEESANPFSADCAREKIALLKQEVRSLRGELAKTRDQICQLQEQEKVLRERLADQVHNQFTMRSGHVFEDLSLGSQRPTSLISAYNDLYREVRVDTLDALDEMPELHGLDILKMKILFSVVVLSFRCVQQAIKDLKTNLRHLLCLPGHVTSETDQDLLSAEMELNINNYLIKSAERYDITSIIKDVLASIYNTLYEYPGLKTCSQLKDYTALAVRIAWGLSVQNPPYIIMVDSRKYQLLLQCVDVRTKSTSPQYLNLRLKELCGLFFAEHHIRFHTSNSDVDDIKSFLWPFLVAGHSEECVSKGVVIT